MVLEALDLGSGEAASSPATSSGLAAMMYAPCTVTAQAADGTKVTIEQKTRYPFEERVELVLTTLMRVAFPLYLRIPAWCRQAQLNINGQPQDVAMKGDNLVRIARAWANGNRLVLDLTPSGG